MPRHSPEGGGSRLRRLGGGGEKPRGLGARLPFLLLTVVLVLAGGILLYRTLFAAPADSGPANVTIEEGESLGSAARKLDESGVIGSATVFEIRARLRGAGTGIKPGEYRIHPGESGGEILTALTEGGEEPTIEVALPEGLTLGQTAARVAGRSGVSEAGFRRAARETGYDYDFLREARSTEGFLFPKKYEFPQGASAEEMVGRMLEQYSLETGDLRFGRAVELPGGRRLTEYQVVTVASLIEREAANEEERRTVASVIYNRLREGMPLQIDATIQYALGSPKESLSLRDLEVDSPYNTYERKGLPPGPIASPGLDSIRAALNPADTEYLYYVLDRDGEEHTFTQGYEEFLEAKERAGR